jgi:GDSL-like Lipase/Acylhydrolase family
MYQSIQSNPRRLWRITLLALAMFASLAALAGVARAANYVALGDSYAAGPLIPNQILPLGCLKSDHNYAHLAAPTIGLSLKDATCSGATTEDMTESQSTSLGSVPPQFDSLGGETTRVSLTIGGNDIGFTEIIENCVTLNPFSTPCKNKYNSGGKDQIAERIAATAPKVAAVLQGIHSHSPSAKVFVLNYAAILPETGYGCWPQMPLGWGDVPYLRSKEKELNAMLATQAAGNGATLVNWYNASIGHDACKGSSTRWVEPLIPTNPAAPVHPNLAGMTGAAAVLGPAAK